MRVRAPLRLSWDSAEVRRRGTATSVSVVDAITAFLLDAPFEEAVAVLDWALRTDRISAADIRQISAALPRRLGSIWHWVDASCDSFPESIARTRLRMAGYRVKSQVPIGARERIDLVIEDQLALEVDGEEHHATRFHKDRRKDLRITVDGRHALRITFAVLMNEWPEVLDGIAAALAARGVQVPRRLTNRTVPASHHTATPLIGGHGRLRLPEFVEGRDP